LRGVRAGFRLLPYLASLWHAAGRVELFHVMANSGWAWHLFAAPAVWVARARGVPVVVNYRGGEAESFLAAQIRIVRPTLARASAIVVPSGFLESVFASHGVITEIVPNVVDVARFAPGERAANDAPHLVVTRNLEPIYDIGTALRAFAIVRRDYSRARMSVAGSGPERGALQSLATALGIADAVAFTGRLDNDALPALYRSADVMLNPSTVDNMPISVLEALASGVPVVTTDVGGIPYLVHDARTALLVPPRDPERMAAAALSLLRDAELASRLASAGREAAQQYTWPRVRERLFSVYERALGRSPGTAVRMLLGSGMLLVADLLRASFAAC